MALTNLWITLWIMFGDGFWLVCANLSNDVDNLWIKVMHRFIHTKENPLDKAGFGARSRPLTLDYIRLGLASSGKLI